MLKGAGSTRSCSAPVPTLPLHVLLTSEVTRSTGRLVVGEVTKSKELEVTAGVPAERLEKVGARLHCEGLGKAPAAKSSTVAPVTAETW